MPLRPCMACPRRPSPICLASCAPRHARASSRERPAPRSSTLQSSGHGKSKLVPKRKQYPGDDKVTGDDIIAFIEQVCFIPEGRYVGKKLELQDWQKTEICRIYDNPHGTRRAILRVRF